MVDLMGSFTTELRITGRIFREMMLGIKRTGWMNIIIIITMASILSIFGVVMAVIIEMSNLVRNIGSDLEISAYVRDSADARTVRDQLLSAPHIRKVILISKEKAWSDWQKDYPLPDVENPLPDTIHIQMSNQEFIPEMVERLKSNPNIIAVQYAKKVLDKIRGITKAASLAGIGLSLFLGTLTLFIISNTVHLLIQAKSREIEILRMMGVGNWYIRLPFVLQGAFYGLLGAMVSYIPLSLAVSYLTRFFTYLGFQTNDLTTSYVSVVLVLMGLLVGAGGAATAIRKYLHV